MDAQKSQALSYYKEADQLAGAASRTVNEANENLTVLNKTRKRLEIWKAHLTNEPITIMSILFIIVAIVEFVISQEIYRVILERAPWAIALAFFLAGLQLSHWLAAKLVKSMQDIKFSEYRNNPLYDGKTDEDILKLVKDESNKHFMWGLVGSIILIVIIGALAYMRVNLEIEAGVRDQEAKMGIYDIVPVVLYIFEIFFGMYFITLLQVWNMKLKIYFKTKKIEKLVDKISHLTAATIENFEKAEEKGLSLIDNQHVSDDIQTAYYRETHLSPENWEDYLAVPQTKDYVFRLKIRENNDKATSKHVHIITQFKATASGGTDENGIIHMTVHTFEEDVVQTIFIGNTAKDPNPVKVIGNYAMGEDKESVINI